MGKLESKERYTFFFMIGWSFSSNFTKTFNVYIKTYFWFRHLTSEVKHWNARLMQTGSEKNIKRWNHQNVNLFFYHHVLINLYYVIFKLKTIKWIFWITHWKEKMLKLMNMYIYIFHCYNKTPLDILLKSLHNLHG